MPSSNRQRQVAASALVVLGTIAAIGIGMWFGHRSSVSHTNALMGWTFVAFAFGVLVGLSEILSRYRDEPLLATATASGLSYLTLNGVISIAAFAVMRNYSTQIFPNLQNDLFLTSIVAGFGGMIVFRSKLFTFKSSDGTEYPIGPAIVLDTVLKTIDSKIDRRRATERQTKVFNSMIQINDFAKTADYLEASLLSFQNLSQDDKTQISSIINQYRTVTKWPDTLKSIGLGFAFLTIAGENNFDVVITNLKEYVRSQLIAPPPAGGPAPPAAGGPGPPPAGGPAPPAGGPAPPVGGTARLPVGGPTPLPAGGPASPPAGGV